MHITRFLLLLDIVRGACDVCHTSPSHSKREGLTAVRLLGTHFSRFLGSLKGKKNRGVVGQTIYVLDPLKNKYQNIILNKK